MGGALICDGWEIYLNIYRDRFASMMLVSQAAEK